MRGCSRGFLCVLGFGMVLVTARADAKDHAQTVAERRALKPGSGLLVVDSTIDLRVGEGLVPDPKGGTRRGGWQPKGLQFELWGKADEAAAIVVTWKDGAKTVGTTQCSVPEITEKLDDYTGNWNDQGEVRCEIKDGAINYPKIGTYDADISYRAAGKPDQLLRKINFTVRNYGSNNSEYANVSYYVDKDYKIAENVGYWDWDGGSLHLRAYTKQEGEFKDPGKLRCTANGQPLGMDGDVQVGGGQSFSYKDGARDKDVIWSQLEGTIFVSRDSGRWKPGRYECQMIIKAKVLRTLRFQLDAKLGIVPSAEQAIKPGGFISRTTLLTDVDIPAGVDAPFSRAAIERQAFLARPWLAGSPKLAAGVGGAYVEPAPFTPPPAASAKGGKKTKKK